MNVVPVTIKQNLGNEYEELQKAAKSYCFHSPSTMINFGFIRKLFSKNGKQKLTEEVSKKPVIQLETNIDAQIPDENLSDPSDFSRINNAGLLFIKLNETPPINKYSRKFTQKFKPLSNTVSLIDTIIASLNPIHVSTSNDSFGISIDSDELKSLLLKCFTTFLKLKPSKSTKKYEWQSPLIIKDETAVAWLKCDLEITVKGNNYGGQKIVEVQLNSYSFYFPTIQDFENALFEAEKKDKDGIVF